MYTKKLFRVVVYSFALIGFVLVGGFFAVKFGLTKTSGVVDRQREFFLNGVTKPAWADGEEWRIFSEAVIKDKADVDRASELSGVPSRLIVAELVSEQLRLFYTNRELFKTIFAPLKILGNQSQFSWGIAGLKQETARAIEKNLKDKTSPFYIGQKYETLLDFKTDDPDRERFERITDEQSRFYTYLYVGLYLKQIINQWEKASFPIHDRPEILSTLFNIGFEHSKPNGNPQTGGSAIEVNGKEYSFGGLSAEFYNSNELLQEFPR